MMIQRDGFNVGLSMVNRGHGHLTRCIEKGAGAGPLALMRREHHDAREVVVVRALFLLREVSGAAFRVYLVEFSGQFFPGIIRVCSGLFGAPWDSSGLFWFIRSGRPGSPSPSRSTW